MELFQAIGDIDGAWKQILSSAGIFAAVGAVGTAMSSLLFEKLPEGSAQRYPYLRGEPGDTIDELEDILKVIGSQRALGYLEIVKPLINELCRIDIVSDVETETLPLDTNYRANEIVKFLVSVVLALRQTQTRNNFLAEKRNRLLDQLDKTIEDCATNIHLAMRK